MSVPGVLTPQSPASSTTPSPTLSAKSLAARSLMSSSATSQPLSPVLKAAAASTTAAMLIPPVSLAVKQQHSSHVRSQSLPSLQRHSPRLVEYPATPVPISRDLNSSSAANLLAQKRENLFAPSQTFTVFFPTSPRLRPVHSPGPVTPMQLEEDTEYRFPAIAAPIKHSPLVLPVTMATEEEMEGGEEVVEIRRSR